MIGLRVGPFEITEAASVPEPGDWYRAKRTGMTRRKPTDVLVQMLHPDASHAERGQLQTHYDNLRGVEDARVPEAVAIYEGAGAIAISGIYGGGLDRIIDARRTNTVVMTPATLLDVLLEIAETLQHAHHRGRCHGHLSAETIWLSPEGQVWIFGFAGGPEAPVADLWLPPERARGEVATEATDQWSLAALAAALITGRIPWRNLDQALAGDPEPIIEPVERQWPALARLLRKMLDNRPANRYPTMHQVRQQLLALSRKAGGTSDRRFLGQWLGDRASDSDAPIMFTAEVDAPVEAPAPAKPKAVVQSDDADEAPTAAILPAIDMPVRPIAHADEEETLNSFDEIPPPPATFADADPPSHASDPDIPEARTMSAASAPIIPRSARTTLPSEQLPVVRPEIPGEAPDFTDATELFSDETAATEQVLGGGNAAAWDLNAPPSVIDPDDTPADLPSVAVEVEVEFDLPQAANVEVVVDVAVDAQPERAPLLPVAPIVIDPSATPSIAPSRPTTHAVSSVNAALDEGSVAISFPEDRLVSEESTDDEEATVLFNQDLLAAELAAAGFVMEDSPAVAVEVQVTPTDPGTDEFTAGHTMVPSTDSRDPSEELYQDGRPLSAGDPSSAGWLPKNAPEPGSSGPALGNATVTLGHEHALPTGEDGIPVPPLPDREISFEQKAAIGAVGVMVLLFVLWALKIAFL